MQLPRSLAPWASILSIFPREIYLALGPLVQRLSRTLGPFHAEPEKSTGEPNGFDGFTRRGSYDRLLLSEWLLADEVPLEFARRAAAGEHSFIRIARREPAAARRTLALFDAGPSQLGGPRIAQLAALIVLARRAESAGAGITWGIVQLPEFPVQHQVTEATVVQLLNARSFAAPSGETLDRWQSQLGLHATDDAWLIGGNHLSEIRGAKNWSRLLINDTYEPAVPRLHVASLRKGSQTPAQKATLDLPEPGVAAQLIRAPFKSAPAPLLVSDTSYRPASNFRFLGTSKIAARSADGGIIVYTFQNSPHDKRTQPRIFARNHADPIIAVARTKRQIIIVSRHAERILRVQTVGGGETPFQGNYVCTHDIPAIGSASLRTCWQMHPGAHPSLLLHLEDGTLLNLSKSDGQAHSVAANTLDIVAAGGEQWYMWRSGKNRIAVGRVGTVHPVLQQDIHSDAGVLLGQPEKLHNGLHPLLAIESSPNRWSIPGYQDGMISTPNGSTAFGVLGCRGRWVAPAIAVLQEDRRTISLIGATWTAHLPREMSDIDQVALNPFSPELAYTTRNELVVYSIARAETLTRIMIQQEKEA